MKIDFGKVAEGNFVVKRGEKCSRLLIIIDGVVEYRTDADDGSYSVFETLNAPLIVQQECIFGRFQEFTSTVKALTRVNTLTLDKSEIQILISKSLVFRLNMLGTLSTSLQKGKQDLWHQHSQTLHNRIASFFRQRCISPVGYKIFKIKMQTLGEILNDSRLDVSHALNDMQRQGLVNLSRGKIEINDLHQLTSSY